MEPLIAVGALLVGGLIARASSSSKNENGSRSSESSRAPLPQQSYVVTPLRNGENSLSAVEAVQRFVV
ncbi:MAG: hypothetical protein AB7P04_15535 [Bacteriovoracia bacterium]